MTFPDRAALDPAGKIVYSDEEPEPTPAIVGASKDAKNRALRTLGWGLATDVAMAVLIYLLPIFGTMSTDWSTLDWKVIAVSLAKTIVMTALSYLARRFKVSLKTTTA